MTPFMLLLSLLIFFLFYIFYAKRIEEKIVQPDPEKRTPAYLFKDGVEYIPARTPLLFGHHFSNIAGAGPIIGPVIAAAFFGWLPAFCWIVLGVVFIGAVHDYLTLSLSMKHQGHSIATITEDILGKGARWAFTAFLWLALLLVIASFAFVSSKTLVIEPRLCIPTFGIVPLAILVGLCIYRLKLPLFSVSIVAFCVAIFLIYLGFLLPLKVESVNFWLICFFIYGLFASLLPVGILDQPRDYICAFTLFVGIIIGILSLLFGYHSIKLPSFTNFFTVEGPLWPMLFIIVACGAVSGFHALVTTGTTAKQLSNEVYQRPVGYGAMLLEGVVAVMALLIVASAFEGKDIFGLLKEKGWIYAFGKGFGMVLHEAFYFIPEEKGATFAMLMLNAFVLTTLDTAIRITRYITQESLGRYISIFKNRAFSSIIVATVAFCLAITNSWLLIWPVFGAANQLIAALCLLVITAALLRRGRASFYTLLPAIFMTATTVSALFYLLFQRFIPAKNLILCIVTLLLLLLSIFMIVCFLKKVRKA